MTDFVVLQMQEILDDLDQAGEGEALSLILTVLKHFDSEDLNEEVRRYLS
jgi:hypothetical protein